MEFDLKKLRRTQCSDGSTCPQCKKLFRQGQHNQRFCNPQCKDDFHNAAKMVDYRLRRAEEAEAELEAAKELLSCGWPMATELHAIQAAIRTPQIAETRC